MFKKGSLVKSKHDHHTVILECTGMQDRTTFEAKVIKCSSNTDHTEGVIEDYWSKETFVPLTICENIKITNEINEKA